jgi:hypothetical protein
MAVRKTKRWAERVAVVFVHGQGQQQPMADVLELARSVWRTDPAAAQGADLAPVYSVPVYDTDTSDQRRIVTRPAPGDHEPVQVDFYQFYWADLVSGNRAEQLWSWFVALVKKDPAVNVIPEALTPLRRLTLGIAVGVALWALAVDATVVLSLLGPGAGRSIAVVVAWLIALALAGYGVLAWGSRGDKPHPPEAKGQKPGWLFDAIDGLGPVFQLVPPLFALLLVILGLLFALVGAQATAADALGLALAGVGAATAFNLRKTTLDKAFAFGLLTLALACVIGPFVEALQRAPALSATLIEPLRRYALGATLAPAALIGGAGYLLYRSFLLPVMTESARLFTPSPCNVPNQERIRERGLRLLTDLHESDAGYDRIVVLAHSLGTAVAYNLLTYYWGKVNGSLPHAAAKTLRERVEALGGQMQSAAAPDPELLLAFRQAVRAHGEALARSGKPGPEARTAWRISDFITIGSPLTYAAFLMEPSDAAFVEQVHAYRRYPLCPPQSLGGAAYGFTFNGVPHHAALFSATCWTNLYFPSHGLAWGDIIGGRIAGPLEPAAGLHANSMETPRSGPRLGWGVLDVALGHDADLKAFTHGDYWLVPHSLAAHDPAPPRTQALRAAFHFFEPGGAADARLMNWPP